MTNIGSTTSASSVSRHSSASIVTSVVTSTMTLLTTLPSVLVTAVWAPITSLLRRLVIAPVGVRVKNAIGIRCTLANRARRRSAIRPSPTRALHQRWTICNAGVTERGADGERGEPEDDAGGCRRGSRCRGSARVTSGGTRASSAATRIATRNTAIVPR